MFLLFFLSNSILSGERIPNYTVTLSKNIFPLASLPYDTIPIITSYLTQKTLLDSGLINKSCRDASVVCVFRNLDCAAFGRLEFNSNRIQVCGFFTGFDERLYFFFNKLSKDFFPFIAKQKCVKLHCVPHTDYRLMNIYDNNQISDELSERTYPEQKLPRSIQYLISFDDNPFEKFNKEEKKRETIPNFTDQELPDYNVCTIRELDYEQLRNSTTTSFVELLKNLKFSPKLTTFACLGGASTHTEEDTEEREVFEDELFPLNQEMAAEIKAGFEELIQLKFNKMVIKEAAVPILTAFVHEHKNLKTFKLIDCLLENENLNSFLSLLKNNSRLATLSLRNSKTLKQKGEEEQGIFTEAEAISYLADVVRSNSTLTKLDIAKTNLFLSHNTNEFIALTQAFCVNTILTDLNISGIPLDNSKSIQSLKKIIQQNTTIKKLKLKKCFFGDGISKILKALHKNSTLTILDLGSHLINIPLANQMLCMLENNPSLTQLNLLDMYTTRKRDDNDISMLFIPETSAKIKFSLKKLIDWTYFE